MEANNDSRVKSELRKNSGSGDKTFCRHKATAVKSARKSQGSPQRGRLDGKDGAAARACLCGISQKKRRYKARADAGTAGVGVCLYAQKRWFPIVTIRGRDQIQALVAVAGLK